MSLNNNRTAFCNQAPLGYGKEEVWLALKKETGWQDFIYLKESACSLDVIGVFQGNFDFDCKIENDLERSETYEPLSKRNQKFQIGHAEKHAWEDGLPPN